MVSYRDQICRKVSDGNDGGNSHSTRIFPSLVCNCCQGSVIIRAGPSQLRQRNSILHKCFLVAKGQDVGNLSLRSRQYPYKSLVMLGSPNSP